MISAQRPKTSVRKPDRCGRHALRHDVKGGAYGFGTLYSITTGGTEKVLHDFHKGTDGNGPLGDLAYERGSLFGITQAGGAYGGGVVFALTP